MSEKFKLEAFSPSAFNGLLVGEKAVGALVGCEEHSDKQVSGQYSSTFGKLHLFDVFFCATHWQFTTFSVPSFLITVKDVVISLHVVELLDAIFMNTTESGLRFYYCTTVILLLMVNGTTTYCCSAIINFYSFLEKNQKGVQPSCLMRFKHYQKHQPTLHKKGKQQY